MNTHVRRARTLALVVLSGAVLAGVGGCSTSVPAADVAGQIVTQLKGQGVVVDNDVVTCPQDLPGEQGQTVRCGFTAGGQPVDAVATVTGVDGSTVNFGITTEAKPVPTAVLEKLVTEQVTGAGMPVERTSCAGELQPQVSRTQTCTATGADGDIPLRVTVTEVRGGLVSTSIERA